MTVPIALSRTLGGSKVLIETADALRARGHEVRIESGAGWLQRFPRLSYVGWPAEIALRQGVQALLEAAATLRPRRLRRRRGLSRAAPPPSAGVRAAAGGGLPDARLRAHRLGQPPAGERSWVG